ETLLLATGGGVFGLLIGRAGVTTLARSLADRLPRTAEIAGDGRVLAFTALVTVGAALLAGLVPAWRLTQSNPGDALKRGLGRSAGGGERRVRDLLVVCEVALAIVLLTGAGLLLRTLVHLKGMDAGFDPHNVVTMNISIPPQPQALAPEDRAARHNAFLNEVLRRIRALPGVEVAAATDTLPFQCGSNLPIAVEGRPAVPISQQPIVQGRSFGSGYLQ